MMEKSIEQPLMMTSMELQIPITLINPNLDDIQSHFTQVLNCILDTHKYIVMWGQRNPREDAKLALKFSEKGKLITTKFLDCI